jgi:hypothetical protein
MFSVRQAPFTIAAAVTMALQPIFLTMSKGPEGFFEYSVGSATFLTEAIKLTLSLTLLAYGLIRTPELRGSKPSTK